MPARKVKFGQESRRILAQGIALAADVVRPTLGPRSRVVVMDSHLGTPEVSVSAIDRKFDTPFLGNDGLGVVREILVRDTFVNQGIFLAKEAARMTKRIAGDGSTTAVLLTSALVREGMRCLAAGVEPRALERGMARAVGQAVKHVRSMSFTIAQPADIAQMAIHAAGGDAELGRAIDEAVRRVGIHQVRCEKGKTVGIALDLRDGFEIERGFVSPRLVTDRERMEAVLDDAVVLVANEKIATARQLLPISSQVATAKRAFLIVADDFEREALALLSVNLLQERLVAVPILSPAYGERRRLLLEDLAAVTGATVLGGAAGRGIERADMGDLGAARRITVRRDVTTIQGGHGSSERITLRVNELARAAEEAGSVLEREDLEKRRAQLAGERIVITIGAPTESEIEERMRRADDGFNAVKAAVREGVVPGGGVALLRAAEAIRLDDMEDDEQAGARAVIRALEDPARALGESIGLDPSVVVARIRELPGSYGLDVQGGTYVDFIGAKILDPALVVCIALQGAAFIARHVLLAEAVVAQPLSGGRLRALSRGPADLPLP